MTMQRGGATIEPRDDTSRNNPEHEELEVRMILKARFSMRWPDRCEI